jgi:hypothetical protein
VFCGVGGVLTAAVMNSTFVIQICPLHRLPFQLFLLSSLFVYILCTSIYASGQMMIIISWVSSYGHVYPCLGRNSSS